MVKRVNISEARSRLFELVDYVSAEGGVVLIEHRGRAERAVLVSEAHLHYLETSLRAHEGITD
jgi:prevent-host-death family protein